MNKLQNANLPANTDPPGSYQRNLNVKLNELFRNIKDAVNRVMDGYLFSIVTVDGDYTVNVSDSIILVDSSAGDVDITLLPPAQLKDKRLTVKKLTAANTVTVIGTIDEATDLAITTQYQSYCLVSDGAEWWII